MSVVNSTTSEVATESPRSSVVAVAIVNSKNRPLFTRVYEHPDLVLPSPRAGETREQQLHYLLFRSLDFIPGEGKSAKETTLDGYLGCINPQEPVPVVAYVTNTGVKVLLAIISRGANDMKLKEVLRNIYKAYVENLLNPFYAYNTPISSAKFVNILDELRGTIS